jgi:hypothetical protein
MSVIRIHQGILIEGLLLLNDIELVGALYANNELILKVKSKYPDNSNILPVYKRDELGVVTLRDVQITESDLNINKCRRCGNYELLY